MPVDRRRCCLWLYNRKPFDAKNRWKLADYCVRAIEMFFSLEHMSAGGRLPREEFHGCFSCVSVCAMFFVCWYFEWLNSTLPCHSICQAHCPDWIWLWLHVRVSENVARHRHWSILPCPKFYERKKKANAYAIDWIDTRQWRRRRSIDTRIPYSFHFSIQVCVCVRVLSKSRAWVSTVFASNVVRWFQVFVFIWISIDSIFYFYFRHSSLARGLTMRTWKRSGTCVLRLFREEAEKKTETFECVLCWTRSFPLFCAARK